MNLMATISENLKRIQSEIIQTVEKCGRSPDSVRLVAVSKTHPAEAVRAAFTAGQRIFGENRVQEAEAKISALTDLAAEWHLVGHLQTNKVKKALALFQLIHSVDSPKLIQALDQEAEKIGKTIDILLQTNLSGELTKSGVSEKELESLIAALSTVSHVRCRGLMTIPPFFEDMEEVRPYFQMLRRLGEQYHDDLVGAGNPLELSMGMTSDFPVAVEEGATLVRIGTAIFGSRNSG